MEQREEALTDRLASEGILVVERDIPEWGRYYRERRLIVLQTGMTAGQRLATLTHEALHHWAGHDGHQDARTEARINRQVALQLVSSPAYIAAEHMHPGSVAGIAWELDLPVWVVESYQSSITSRAATLLPLARARGA